ncbi:modulator of FtsH protease [Gammaproteobacteria bacterium]
MRDYTYAAGAVPQVDVNKLIRNTYLLLSITLLFSAATATFAVLTRAPVLSSWLVLIVSMGLLFVTHSLRNSSAGLVSVFALTGFLGYTLGPIIGFYLRLPNGGQIVATAMGGTGAIFLGLSFYALTTRKDFSFMGGFLMVGIITAILGSLAALFFQIPALSLAVSGMIVLLMSGYILYDTSAMIHGGIDNYIVATINLYLNIYNLFLSLLQILGMGFGSDD